MDSVSWSRNAWCVGLKPLERGQLEDALDLPFEDQTAARGCCCGGGIAQAGGDADVVGRHVGQQDLLLLQGALADQSLAQADPLAEGFPVLPTRSWPAASAAGARWRVQHVEHGVLGGDDGAQLGEDHAAHGGQVALALEHTAELGQVGLEPVLLGVLLRRVLAGCGSSH